MSANLAAVLYLVAGVLFILALRGLSSPASARQGNTFGMVGMAIAILTTLAVAGVSDPVSWALILGGMGIGGVIGAVMARKIAMTAMPQLVAAFHSLVGMAAVFVAAAALYAPEAFDIATGGVIHVQALVEMSLGAAIGAFTFTGSVIAFLKLDGRMSGTPIILPARHVLHGALGLLLVFLVWQFSITGDEGWFWAITAVALVLGVLMIIPIGGADMPVVIAMLNAYSGLAAAATGLSVMPWIQEAPRSVTSPSVRSVCTRPPTRSRASRMTTVRPAATSSRAAVSPAIPAPMTTVSKRSMP